MTTMSSSLFFLSFSLFLFPVCFLVYLLVPEWGLFLDDLSPSSLPRMMVCRAEALGQWTGQGEGRPKGQLQQPASLHACE